MSEDQPREQSEPQEDSKYLNIEGILNRAENGNRSTLHTGPPVVDLVVQTLVELGFSSVPSQSELDRCLGYDSKQSELFHRILPKTLLEELFRAGGIGLPEFVHDGRLPFPFYQDLLKQHHREIRLLEEGGTRSVFIAQFGKERRVIKIDRALEKITSPRSLRHIARGYTTQNDIETLLSIEDPSAHHIVRLLQVDHVATDHGLSAVAIEEYFPSESLEKFVLSRTDRGQRISAQYFTTIFEHVLIAEKYLVEKEGLFHRDVKPSNILVGTQRGLEARITDLANACKVDATEVKFLPTAGSHFVIDPRLIAAFTGEERKYDVQSEIYSIGMSMLYTLAGKYPVEYDPDAGTAQVLATRESLLNAKGRLNVELHRRTIEDTLRSLPRDVQRFAPVIRKCVGLGEDNYRSLAELVADFKRASAPTIMERARALPIKWWNLPPRIKAMSVLGIAAVAGLAWLGHDYVVQTQQELEEVTAESAKYVVSAGWDDNHLEIVNNLLSLDIFARSYRFVELMPPKHYPYDINFLSVQRGDEIIVNAAAQQLALPQNIETSSTGPFDIAVYIEGYAPANTENAILGRPLKGRSVERIHGGFSINPHVEVPQDLPEGTYSLIVELSVPSPNSIVHNLRDKRLRLPSPGTVIAQKRIPFVVGLPANKVAMNSLRFSGYWNEASFASLDSDDDSQPNSLPQSSRLAKQILPRTTIEMSIPGTEYAQRVEKNQAVVSDLWFSLTLPRGDDPVVDAILQTVVRNPEGVIEGYSFFPVERKPYDPVSGGCTWKLAMPDARFKEKIIPLAEKIRAEMRRERK